jgi:lipopolysaccharide transport system permease protein
LITPVMYPLNAVPTSVRPWLLANPMTGVVESFRRVLVIGKAPTLDLLAPTLVATAIALIIGYWYFAATERRFADVI